MLALAKKSLISLIIASCMLPSLSACSRGGDVGRVCLGDNLDTLFEALPRETMRKVKKGDIIATKNPGLWLDFNYPVAYNDYNSAFGKFAGFDRKLMMTDGTILTTEEYIEKMEKQKSKEPAQQP